MLVDPLATRRLVSSLHCHSYLILIVSDIFTDCKSTTKNRSAKIFHENISKTRAKHEILLTLSMVRTPPRPAKKRHHGSIQSRRRPPPPRVNHPAGRQERGAPDPLCHAPDPRTGHRAQHPPDPRCHAAHRAAPGNGRRSGPSVGRHLFVPRAGDRLRLPAHGRLPPPLRAPARLGDAHRPDVGPLRRGLHPQAGRRQDRPPQDAGASTPTSSVSRSSVRSSTSMSPTIFSWSRAGS